MTSLGPEVCAALSAKWLSRNSSGTLFLQKREHLERVRFTCFEFHVFFGRRKGECLFVFLRGLIECVESACVEVTDKDVEAFGVLDQYLEPLKEVLPIFVCDEREVGMNSHRLSYY